MMKSLVMTALVSSLALMSGCKNRPVENFGVEVGDNSVTTILDLSDKFALSLDGSFPIDIKGANYGEIFLSSKTDDKPFQVGLTISIEAFTSDVWDGFGPTTTLPNGDPLPGWITPYELVGVDIPSFSEHFELGLFGGYHNPYYVGLSVELKILDNHYPEGLQISQNFKKDGEIWGTVTLFGPTRDGAGNVVQHGGIFFVVGINPFLPGDYTDLEPGEVEFLGPSAHRYQSKRAQKQLMEKVQSAIKEFNQTQELH